MLDVAGDDGESVLEGGGGDEEIEALVAEGPAQLAPAAGGWDIHGQHAPAVPGEDFLQPVGQVAREGGIAALLLGDAAFDLADGDGAEVKIGGALIGQPGGGPGVTAPPTQGG